MGTAVTETVNRKDDAGSGGISSFACLTGLSRNSVHANKKHDGRNDSRSAMGSQNMEHRTIPLKSQTHVLTQPIQSFRS
jgi:hypothetical protein